MYNTTELDEALYGLAKLMNAGKTALDDDGKLTLSDSIHFLTAIIPVWNGVAGADKIIINIADLTPEQKDESKAKFLQELKFHPLDENAFDKLFDWLFSTLEMFKGFGVVKTTVEV